MSLASQWYSESSEFSESSGSCESSESGDVLLSHVTVDDTLPIHYVA